MANICHTILTLRRNIATMKHAVLCLLLFVATFLPAQTLQEYFFNNSLAGTGGGGNLTELLDCNAVAGGFGSDSIITSNGLCSVSQAFCFNSGGGFSYPNNSITGSYTINLFFKFSAALTGYSRIIDFSNSTSDGGFYLLGNCLNFYPNGNVGTCPYFQPNVYYLFTFVRDGNTNVISVYVNGTLFSTYTDATNIYKPATNTTPIIFFKDDNLVRCEVKPGCIKYASVSPQQLTAPQVDSIWQNICNISLPPCAATINYAGNPYSTTLSTPQSVTLTGTTGGTYSSTAGLTINAGTGAITPSTSTPGSYTITYTVADSGVCSGISTTANVTIAGAPGCSAQGNTIIFSNYDGGTLNINVDVNIPNLKIGVVSYEPVQINLTGPYAGNVTKVIRAGFPNTSNNHCTPSVTATAINGPTPANYFINDIPPVGLSNPNGYASGIICAYSCNTTTNQGGCNTIDQVLDYFNTQLGGSVYSLSVQYCCWKATNTYQVSALGGSCCVSSSPSATIAYAGTPYCKSLSTDQPVSLTGSANGSYSASPSGLSINAATGAINPSTSTAGIYTVTYTVAGCPDYTTTAAVEIINSPSATISYPADSFCIGAAVQAVTLTGTTGGQFSAASGLSLNTTTGAIDPAASTAGSYTVTYTIAGSGCTGLTTTAPVTISQTISTGIARSICPGASYNFGGQVLTTAGTYLDHSFTAAGCDSLTSLVLTVDTLPAATITAANTKFCPGDSAQICAPAGFTTYQWNAGSQSRCIYVRNAGNYYVTVTNASNCSAESNRIAMSTYPTPSVSVSVNSDTLSVYNAEGYQWFLNGAPIGNATANTYVAEVNGNYQVQVTDTNGCKALSNNIPVTVTGITEVLNAGLLNVYPNPLQNGMWTIECNKDMLGKTLEIFDASGRIVYRAEIATTKSVLSFEAAKGIYYLRISGLNGVVKKLVRL